MEGGHTGTGGGHWGPWGATGQGTTPGAAGEGQNGAPGRSGDTGARGGLEQGGAHWDSGRGDGTVGRGRSRQGLRSPRGEGGWWGRTPSWGRAVVTWTACPGASPL